MLVISGRRYNEGVVWVQRRDEDIAPYPVPTDQKSKRRPVTESPGASNSQERNNSTVLSVKFGKTLAKDRSKNWNSEHSTGR